MNSDKSSLPGYHNIFQSNYTFYLLDKLDLTPEQANKHKLKLIELYRKHSIECFHPQDKFTVSFWIDFILLIIADVVGFHQDLHICPTALTDFFYFLMIRAPGVLNTNIETQGLRNPNDNHNSDVAHSDILGRAVVESNEWVQFTAQSERDFFIDIHQKQLNVLRLKLTDSKNRSIGRRGGSYTVVPIQPLDLGRIKALSATWAFPLSPPPNSG